ncbi:diacylglycerol/lipid kinase family protein [Pedobacter duraquae]|uniref:YegS/Rv2252/BmrU family lipid kinase n=1 Tax=Pedobacter duraquae TaxID=425511 RepID=A0A4R6IEG2_9SPHI|nr:YegS/Rv2252/BmrU family lipid kinase [Pedobacter duraquae]TDO20017.1 YegS/Rv2252/BmrU family lipid kinase [Pedobacter duraquae]
METPKTLKLLFIINPGSGAKDFNFKDYITNYFEDKEHEVYYYNLPKQCSKADLTKAIKNAGADRVVAVGGDGTLKLVAEAMLQSDTPIGLIPAGSANGMARELGIPDDPDEALDIIITGNPKKIHAVIVNDELCIHLADIGFNAYIIKKFDDLPQRGMLGYAKAAWQALWKHHKMEVEIHTGDETVTSEAAMVVIANATMYGTGVQINPDGKLDDDVFEVILIKKYSIMEILKIKFTNLPFNPETIEIFKTNKLQIKSKHKAHFQVDGEYQGKVNSIEAKLVPEAIQMIVSAG